MEPDVLQLSDWALDLAKEAAAEKVLRLVDGAKTPGVLTVFDAVGGALVTLPLARTAFGPLGDSGDGRKARANEIQKQVVKRTGKAKTFVVRDGDGREVFGGKVGVKTSGEDQLKADLILNSVDLEAGGTCSVSALVVKVI